MKYIFKQVDDYTPSETTTEFTADTLDVVLEMFTQFLRGSGFYFDGVIDIVPEETFQMEDYFGDGHEGMGSTLEDYPELDQVNLQHSEHYYDTDRNKAVSNFLKEYDSYANTQGK